VSDDELPEGWRWVALDEAASIEDGRRVPLNSDERANRRGPYPYFGANGQVDSIDEFRYEGDHVLVAEDGGYYDDPSRGVAYLASGKFWVNNHAHVLRPSPAVHPVFLRDALNRVPWMEFVSGTTRLKLTQAALRRVRIPLPALDEQRRIVAKLDALRARSRRAKDSLDAVPALLDRLRQSILAAAFRGDLTADWREQNPDVEPATELLKRIRIERRKRWEEAELAKLTAKGKPPKDDRWKQKYVEPQPVDESELPELPDGWCWASVDEVAECQDGRRVPLKREDRATRQGPYPYYGASGIIDTIDDFLFEGAHLLLAEDGANLLSRSTPIAFDADGRFWVNNHAHVLLPLISRDYLREALNSLDLAQSVTGTAQPKLTQAAMARLPVPLAPTAEQTPILLKIAAMRSAERATTATSIELTTAVGTLDSAILAAAFRGELLNGCPERVADH